MAVLLEGSKQDDETKKLLEAMSAISLDPETEQQRQPPAIGLRGAGAAFQVMGASVAKDAGNVFKVRKKNGTLAVSRAAKDGNDEGKKGGNRFSSSPCRFARIGKGKARELGEITEAETGHGANKRHNKNRSPVWRTGGKKNEEFMQEHRYGYQHGSGNRGDGDGGEGGRAGPPQKNGSDDDEGESRAGPAVVDVDDGEISSATWDDCMGVGLEGEEQEPKPGDLVAAENNYNTAKTLRDNIVTKREQVEHEQRMVLVLLNHVYTCRKEDQADGESEACTATKHCGALKRMWHHVKNCDTTSCPTAVSREIV